MQIKYLSKWRHSPIGDASLASWHPSFMSTDVAKPKVTPAQILEQMKWFTAPQVEAVMQGVALMRLQKRKRVLSERESELLRIINRGLSTTKRARAWSNCRRHSGRKPLNPGNTSNCFGLPRNLNGSEPPAWRRLWNWRPCARPLFPSSCGRWD